MAKKRIILIILLVILIFLLLAGFIFLFDFIEKKNSVLLPLEKENSSQNELTNIPFADDLGSVAIASSDTAGKTIEKAKKSGEAADCLNIEDGKKAVSCVYALAGYLKNKNVCLVIEDEAESAKCSDMADYNKSLSEGNLKFCSDVVDPDLAKACVASIIDEQKLDKNSCKSLAVREKRACQAYFDYLNDSILFSKAESKSDCEAISGESEKEQCLGNFKNRLRKFIIFKT